MAITKRYATRSSNEPTTSRPRKRRSNSNGEKQSDTRAKKKSKPDRVRESPAPTSLVVYIEKQLERFFTRHNYQPWTTVLGGALHQSEFLRNELVSLKGNPPETALPYLYFLEDDDPTSLNESARKRVKKDITSLKVPINDWDLVLELFQENTFGVFLPQSYCTELTFRVAEKKIVFLDLRGLTEGYEFDWVDMQDAIDKSYHVTRLASATLLILCHFENFIEEIQNVLRLDQDKVAYFFEGKFYYDKASKDLVDFKQSKHKKPTITIWEKIEIFIPKQEWIDKWIFSVSEDSAPVYQEISQMQLSASSVPTNLTFMSNGNGTGNSGDNRRDSISSVIYHGIQSIAPPITAIPPSPLSPLPAQPLRTLIAKALWRNKPLNIRLKELTYQALSSAIRERFKLGTDQSFIICDSNDCELMDDEDVAYLPDLSSITVELLQEELIHLI